MKCCYCKAVIQGEVQYCIPVGYPNDSRNDGLPLCAACGSSHIPTLDTICWALDEERANRLPLLLIFWTFGAVVAGTLGGIVFGPWGLLACPGLGLLGVVVLRALKKRGR